MIENDGPLLRAEDVAKRLHASRGTVRTIPAAELPYLQLRVGGTRKYREADVTAYLERRWKRA